MKILAILFADFTATDLCGPFNAWAFMPGAEFQTAAKVAGPVKTDMGLEIVASHDFSSCCQSPDVLFVPGGGMGVFRALQDDEFLDTIARIGAAAGWVTSVCNGALLLGAAGLLKGYRSACYWYARHHLAKFGAIPDEARYVIDRNRASGGGITAGIDFGLHMIGAWQGAEHGRIAELLMEYAPQPPFRVGRPELAPQALLGAVAPILRQEMPDELIAAVVRRRF